MTLRDALNKPIIQRVQKRTGQQRGGQRQRWGGSTLADVIGPESFELHRDMIQVGDSYICILEARSLPTDIALAWLNNPSLGFDAQGISVHQRLVPVPKPIARKLLEGSERAGADTERGDAQAGTAADLESANGMDEAAKLRWAMAQDTDRLIRYAITVTVSAATPELLRDQVDTLRLNASQLGLDLRPARSLQWEGYVESLPIGKAELSSGELGLLHDTTCRVVMAGLPTTSPGLRRRPGELPLLWGEHPRTGVPILRDRRALTNAHMVVLGNPGNGKSYAVRGLIAQEVALGDVALLILDPKNQEYKSLVKALGGLYVPLSSQSGIHINPLQLPPMTPDRIGEIIREGFDLLGERISTVKTMIVGELQATGTMTNAEIEALVETAITQAYRVRGITHDPGTFQHEMPTFSDVQAHLRTIAETDADAETQTLARRLARAMNHFTEGTIGALFNHQSNVRTDNAIIGIDIWPLLRTNNPSLKRLVPVIVTDFFLSVALNRPSGRQWYNLVIDEGHTLLETDAGAKATEMIGRVGRALKISLTLITQSLKDLKQTTQAQVLLEMAKTKLILGLGQASDAVAYVAEILGLNEAEAAYLGECRFEPGIGATAYLIADDERTPLMIPKWPDLLHELVTDHSRVEEI